MDNIESMIISLREKHAAMGVMLKQLERSYALRNQYNLPMHGVLHSQVLGAPGHYHRIVTDEQKNVLVDIPISDVVANELIRMENHRES